MDLISCIGTWVDWDVRSLLLFITIFLLLIDYNKNQRPDGFPPGPPAFPLVGNMFSVDYKKTHESMTQLAGKYGDVYSLRMGPEWQVVLSGYEVLREALVNQGDSLADRPPLPLIMDLTNGRGVSFSNGAMWKQQRRFMLSTLRQFGFGKKSLEPVILDEFMHCIKELNHYKGKPFNPHQLINNAVSNIICSLVFGHRFEYSDERFKHLIGCFEEALQCQVSIGAQLYNAFPLLMRHLPGSHQRFLDVFNITKDFIREEIKTHKQNLDPSDQKDFIDCYLKAMQTSEGQSDNTFDEENLVVCCFELFVAGTESTSTTLRWAFLYMAKYPEIQAKVQAEIDRVIGQSGQMSMKAAANLPFTEAVLHEVQRFSNIVPLGVPRMTTRETQLKGYTLPKGITVIPNLTSVLHSKTEWDTPFDFNPGHFLDKDGKFVKPAAFLPFCAGKRVCLGESLAKMELFLFFTSFLQHFTFSMPAGIEPVLDYHFGVTLAPHDYEICATPC